MVKVYYIIELSNGINYSCLLEMPKYKLGQDYQTLYYQDHLAFTISSIKEWLLVKEFHTNINDDRIIRGSSVVSIYNVSFGH